MGVDEIEANREFLLFVLVVLFVVICTLLTLLEDEDHSDEDSGGVLFDDFDEEYNEFITSITDTFRSIFGIAFGGRDLTQSAEQQEVEISGLPILHSYSFLMIVRLCNRTELPRYGSFDALERDS